MFGGHYYNLDAALAAGKLGQAQYAALLLEAVINRANTIRVLYERQRSGAEVDTEEYQDHDLH
ncbi:MAG: hypothetical protein JSW71_14025 [Gemmatimonadota bacterium]|nr:MAG: hypothetical protein JSW71_14025 [Gemmatimonadota bacterium]